MDFIKNKAKKDFVIPLKSNRNVFLSAPSEKTGKPVKLESFSFDTDEVKTLYLEKLDFPVLVSRQVFQHENGTEGILYLCTSDLTLSGSALSKLYQKRWKVEEYHKSLKSNASFAKSPTKRPWSQSNHFFASVVAFIKMEICRGATHLNHFAQRMQLYIAATASAFEQLRLLKKSIPGAAITL
jgi:Transposase DDE domain